MAVSGSSAGAGGSGGGGALAAEREMQSWPEWARVVSALCREVGSPNDESQYP